MLSLLCNREGFGLPIGTARWRHWVVDLGQKYISARGCIRFHVESHDSGLRLRDDLPNRSSTFNSHLEIPGPPTADRGLTLESLKHVQKKTLRAGLS